MKIKCLSVRQPWANLIAQGKKTIETRTWSTTYRGPLLIVSSRKPDIAPAGYGLAVIQLIDCRMMTVQDEEAACCPQYAGAYSWILNDIKPIKPFPVKGNLSIYEIEFPKELLAFMSDYGSITPFFI